MGLTIEKTEFVEADYRRFSRRLGENLEALEQLLQTPGFGEGEITIGSELELYIVDADGRPLCINQEINDSLNDPQLTLELNRYNLEYNFSPVAIKSAPFKTTEQEARQALQRINDCAGQWGGKAMPIGILPTLLESDFGYHAMTRLARYEVLTRELRSIRGGPFHIDIHSKDSVHLEMEDVTLEGANTSFQVHLRVPPAEFVDTYNALQLVTPLATALCANSPTLFGHQLWHETRIPLFKQSIDCRKPDPLYPRPPRVNFGHTWLRRSAFELFQEAVYLYRPLIPVLSDEDPVQTVSRGQIPQLLELRLQQGSVWLWNRPVYDPEAGGHLRIEMRALPAGPSLVDTVANSVLLIGLTMLLKPHINELIPALPFEYAARNFYRAAEKGLAAELIWPTQRQCEPEYRSVCAILQELMPQLPQALQQAGFPEDDFAPYLEVLSERLKNKQTGSQWQLDRLNRLLKDHDKEGALRQMFSDYCRHSQNNQAVSQWAL